LPEQAKSKPDHEPRNGVVMCANHQLQFDAYDFFIRFFPSAGSNSLFCVTYSHEKQVNKFVLINYCDIEQLRPFHGRAVALDTEDAYAPFTSSFVIHEMRVRGFHPFEDPSPFVPADKAIDWQSWVTTDGVWDSTNARFHRRANGLGQRRVSGPQIPSMTPINSGEASDIRGTQLPQLNNNVISDILAAMYATPSWKGCVKEGTSWAGTAEENIEKYHTTILRGASESV
jgi:hypothetical protein